MSAASACETELERYRTARSGVNRKSLRLLQFRMVDRIFSSSGTPHIPMYTRTLAVLGALLVLISAGLPAQSKLFPVEELKPGMIAVGRTVFAGEKLEDFKVEIIGVLR